MKRQWKRQIGGFSNERCRKSSPNEYSIRWLAMKNILTVSPDDFEKQVHLVSFSQLKSLLMGIRDFKSKHLTVEQVIDIERKETKIWKELQRRGILNDKTNVEFMAWLRKFNKKTVF